MTKKRGGTLVAIISILFLGSLVFNWIQYRQSRKMHDAAYENGFYFAFIGINRASEIFSGKLKSVDTMDAVVYLSEAAGQFQAFSHIMENMGVDHTMGIGMELEQEAKVISHPQKYSKSQIQQAVQFVKTVSSDFKICWNAQYLIKSRVPGAIDKIYKAMPLQDRQRLYSMK